MLDSLSLPGGLARLQNDIEPSPSLSSVGRLTAKSGVDVAYPPFSNLGCACDTMSLQDA